MIIYPSQLIPAAEEAGMKVPQLSKNDEFNPELAPHFHVFCQIQLGRPLTNWNEHWENAKVIASVPDDQIRTITTKELIARGVVGLPSS